METTKSKSALEVLQNPEAILKILTEETLSTTSDPQALPSTIDKELAQELVIEMAEGVAQENASFQVIYNKVQQKNAVVSRDISMVIDYAAKAYEFVGNHWGEIFFILSFLNNKGYFDKLKDKPKYKTFFETLFEEEVKEEDTTSDGE